MRNSQKDTNVPDTKLSGLIKRMGIFTFLGLIASLLLFVAAVLVTFRKPAQAALVPEPTSISIDFGDASSGDNVSVPAFSPTDTGEGYSRSTYFQTSHTDKSGYQVLDYTVQDLDSIFGIAKAHNIEPETLLWANEDIIVNVDELSPGEHLRIPPVDGVYYKWQAGDTLDSVAKEYSVTADAIINWPGNNFTDLTNPVIEPGTFVMIPGGQGDFQSWVMPVVPVGAAGVDTHVYGSGGCSGSYSGAGGSGSFIWPTPIHTLTGNDFWSGHLGVDLATDPSTKVFAADSGIVIFSGWSTGGYGNMVMIDHQNGYQTVYAHLSSTVVSCGQSVGQGQQIGWGGSTGNSTGNHLHFEIRLNGGYVNPWYYLP